jgi:quinoprotein glucose dehydrogenase
MARMVLHRIGAGFILSVFVIGGAFALRYNKAQIPIHSIGLNKSLSLDYRLETFAPSDLTTNPVSMSVDDSGKLFVTETNRIVIDAISPNRLGLSNREDLSLNTVQDRVDTLKRIGAGQLQAWSRFGEAIRVIEDRNNDGKADHSEIYADQFNDLADVIGAGILNVGDDVYFTCSPNLWKLTTRSASDGRVEVKRDILITGFSPHFSGVGHCLHGLIQGPDGKIYFSVGDSGLNVTTKDGTIKLLDTGAIMRCEPDGSQFEVVAVGLRNPQELAFNQFGDLFTADNDQDPGDQTRWIHVVEGGDYGWRSGILPLNESPWLREKLWTPYWPGQPSYIVPPVAILPTNLGPCGLTYYPGVGFPKEFNDTFFLCNFGYTQAASGVQAIRMKPKGASYELTEIGNFVDGLVPTDVEFSWKGEMYISRWEEGGNPSNNGRIERLWFPDHVRSESTLKNTVLSKPVAGSNIISELIDLLSSEDIRIRNRAQLRLTDYDEAVEPLINVARTSTNRIARIHAIWALDSMSRKRTNRLDKIVDLLSDHDSEIRAQTARALGDARVQSAMDRLISSLIDVEPRVQFHAAIALGKLGGSKAFQPLIQLIKNNADRDPVLRHAAVLALSKIADCDQMERMEIDSNASVRLAILLAYRRLKSENIARFLNDPDMYIAVEAARAIVDVPIRPATPRLAEMLNQSSLPDALIRRSMEACNIIGSDEDMRRIAQFAARNDVSDLHRAEAVRLLKDWFKPSSFSISTGLRQTLEPRSTPMNYSNIRSFIPLFVQNPTDDIAEAVISLIDAAGFADEGDVLERLASNVNLLIEIRLHALRVMIKSHKRYTSSQVEKLISNSNPLIQIEALRFIMNDQPRQVFQRLKKMIKHPLVRVRQKAWEVLGEVPGNDVDELLIQGLDDLSKGRVDYDSEIEIVESANKRSSLSVLNALHRYRAEKLKLNDPVESRRSALSGGDAIRGESLFMNGSGETACPRCHSIQYRMLGGKVGPDLSGLGLRRNRSYILESLTAPSKSLATGYETTVVALSDGRILSGKIQSENDKEIDVLIDGRLERISKSEIDDRKIGKSAMPDDVVKNYSDRELRDLVEFLANLGSDSSRWSKFGRFTEGLPKRSQSDFYHAGIR